MNLLTETQKKRFEDLTKKEINTVYLLLEHGPEDFQIIGVFTSEELAEEARKSISSPWKLEIDKWELNKVLA